LTSFLGKAWLPALAVFAVFAMFAFGSQTKSAEADVTWVEFVEATFLNDDDDCDETFLDAADDHDDAATPYILGVGEQLAICIQVDNNDVGSVVSADSDDYGSFVNAYCSDQDDDGDDFEIPDDECANVVGSFGSDDIEIACGGEGNAEGETFSLCDNGTEEDILLFWECEDEAGTTSIEIGQSGDGDPLETVVFWVHCAAQPDTVTVTATPTKVEIIPQIGSVAHSEITVAISGDGLPVDLDDLEIDYSVPKCAIEVGNDSPDTSPLTDSVPDDDDFVYATPTSGPNADKLVISNVWFHADWNNCTPGDVVVTVVVEVDDGADIVRTVTINVVGPPAFITATAAPSTLICGEKSTITVKVTDAIGQNVSDNTQVELISNWGSVIAGTGATLGFPGTGPVNPLASSAAATYNGVAIAYLLTSNNHVGAYEVVAAAGGTVGLWGVPGDEYPYWWEDDEFYHNPISSEDVHPHIFDYSLYKSAPITTQVTVTCSLPAAPVAPTVTSPNTGTGSITPPNTGDAGLASSSSNAMLFVLVGAAAFVLAGIASVSYARR
jgi:hypothetical protein